MKTATLVLDIIHIVVSAAMLVLMPTLWAHTPVEAEALS